MKKICYSMLAAVLALSLLAPFGAPAQDAPSAETKPVLNDISFKNAVINEAFSPFEYDYTLTLEEPSLTPTLKNYAVSDNNADLFVTYATDDTMHQTGIVATLEYEGGTTVYTFTFSNAQAYAESSDNLLAEVNCNLGEVYPALNDKLTDYRIYIPSDLTVLEISAATRDIGAQCLLTKEWTLKPGQETTIPATVTATNGDQRVYTFKVKRLEKTSAEVRAEMAQPDFESLVQGELFYQKPAFLITVCAVAGALILLLLFVALAKRLTVKTEDADEKDFFLAPSAEE